MKKCVHLPVVHESHSMAAVLPFSQWLAHVRRSTHRSHSAHVSRSTHRSHSAHGSRSSLFSTSVMLCSFSSTKMRCLMYSCRGGLRFRRAALTPPAHTQQQQEGRWGQPCLTSKKALAIVAVSLPGAARSVSLPFTEGFLFRLRIACPSLLLFSCHLPL